MIDQIVVFFESQGWLSNLLEIGSFFLLVFMIPIWKFSKKIYLKNKENKISSLEKFTEDRLIKYTTAKDLKVVIVDDQPSDYPIDSLIKLGYRISKVEHLTIAEIPSLRNYDCIFLDINGVLEEDANSGGLEILKRLKSPKGPYIVAVSSRGFDISVSNFFMLANHRLKKPIPAAEIEGIIEEAFKTDFSVRDAASRIDKLFGFGVLPSSEKTKVLRAMKSYIESGYGLNQIKNFSIPILPVGYTLEPLVKDLDIIRRFIESSND